MTNHPHRRIYVLIDKAFQLNVTFFVLAIFLVQNLFFVLAIYFWSEGVYGYIANDEIAHQLEMHQGNLILFLFLYSLISLCVVFVLMIFKTHKIIGPIYKLKKTLLDSKEKGKMEKLIFRQGDYFDDLPEIYNDVIEKVKSENQ